MTASFWIALGIVIFGAFSYATASILQAVAARRCNGTVQTMRHPLYLLGILLDMLAWVGAMIALRELAVYVVESVLAGSLAITVIAARIVLKSRLRPRDVSAIIISLTALTVLSLSAGPQEDVHASTTMRWAFCTAAVLVVIVGVALSKLAVPAGAIAALGGLCLGSAALVGRSLPMDDALTDPLTVALLTFAFTGMLLYANALGRGEVGPVTAIHWTFEVVVPSGIALFLLGDTVRPGWGVAATIAGVVTVASAVLLATAPATSATALPPENAGATTSLPPLSVPSERIIWWGPPPIWTPPKRTRPALASAPVPVVPALAGRARPELTWTPAQQQPVWTPPLRPDTDAVPAAAASEWPAPAASEWPAPAGSEWPAPAGSEWPAQAASDWPSAAASDWPAQAASDWPDARPWDAYADDVPEPVRVTRPQSRPSLRPWDDL